MTELWHDIRFSLRSLRQRPGFAAVAVLTMALGVGANSAIFSAVHALLLAPLPYPDADRLALLWMDNTRLGIRQDITSFPGYRHWREGGARHFADMAIFRPIHVNITAGEGEPERLAATITSANFLPLLQVTPLLGRGFTAEEEVSGRENVVLLSYGLWQRRFGGDRQILGRSIAVNDEILTVIGVLPPNFDFPQGSQLWAPLVVSESSREQPFSFWLYVLGRLQPGVTLAQAQQQMDLVAVAQAEEEPQLAGYGVFVQPLRNYLLGDTRLPLLVLMAAVGLVLLIACANVANLLLARAAGREREMSIRLALGASRRRLIRQLLTESAVLALLGGACGLLVARWGISALTAAGPEILARPGALGMHAQVLAFTLALALATGLAVGLVPALQASRGSLTGSLQEGSRGTTGGRHRHRVRNLLVTSEVTLAALLLIAAALLLQSFQRLRAVDPGLRTTGIVTLDLALPAAYGEETRAQTFYQQLLEKLTQLPGVDSAAAVSTVLLPQLARSGNFTIEGRPDPPPAERIEVPFDAVTPGLFQTLGIPLLAGRDFTASDQTGSERVVIVNQSMARRFWPDGNALGQRIAYGSQGDDGIWRTIVGVVGDAQRNAPTEPVRPCTYLPHAQAPIRMMTVAVRTAVPDPLSLAGTLRQAVWDLDPKLPISNLATIEAALAERLAERRFHTLLLGLFAAVALLLAAVGIYGVLAQVVGQSKRELGIRVALGAARSEILALVLRQGLRPVIAGLALGVLGALGLTRLLASLLFGVSGRDPATFATVPLLILLVALLACLLPALRATRVHPMEVLREE